MPSRIAVTIALIVLTLLQAWVGWRLLSILTDIVAWQVAGTLFLTLLLLSIPLGLFAHRIARQPLADRLSWVGMLAMGFFSSLLLLTLLLDIILLLCSIAGVSQSWISPTSAWMVVSGAVLLTLVGYFSARRIARVVDVDVPIAHLPPHLDGFVIVQISDIHVGPTIKRTYVQAIVDKVNALQADVIAITGDLVDGSVRDLTTETQPLKTLRARYGTYFVTGNHEYYSNADEWVDEIRRLGVTVLMNEHVVLQHAGASVVLAGITDYGAHHFNPAHRSDPVAALAGAPADSAVNILLAHQPRSAPAVAKAGFDLQLSGHTHGGQFFPWNFFVPLQQPYVAGLHRLQNLWVYISRGTGYWGPPNRLWIPSEITRLRLRSA